MKSQFESGLNSPEIPWTLVETAIPQISTCDCDLDGKHLFVTYEELLFSHSHMGLLSQQN